MARWFLKLCIKAYRDPSDYRSWMGRGGMPRYDDQKRWAKHDISSALLMIPSQSPAVVVNVVLALT